jgi:hypothetical protein
MDEQKWETRLKVLTQAAAICLVGVYVVGFLVVSTYHVRFGIPGFDFIRTRIISAGVLFLVFLAFPLWELAGIYDWIKWPQLATQNITNISLESQKNPKREVTPLWLRIYAPVLKVFLFLGASFGVAFLVNQNLTVGANQTTVFWALGSIGLSGAIYVVSALLRTRFELTSFFLVLATLPIYAFGAWKTHDRGFQLLVVWFLACGITAQGVLRAKKDPSYFFTQALHNILLNLLFPLVLFAAYVYPRIRPVIGGGAPVPIIIYCTDVPPFANSTEVKAKLLDETDSGFYLLLSPDDKQAIFLPRSAVRAIKFVSQ